MEQHFYLLTGVMASGKSTTAQRWRSGFPGASTCGGMCSAKMIVTGREEMTQPGPSPPGLGAAGLRYRLRPRPPRGLLGGGGFSVGAARQLLRSGLGKHGGVAGGHPRAGGGALPRCGDRQGPGGRPGQNRLRGLCACPPAGGVRRETPRLGFWLDNSRLTVEESVEKILEHFSA